MHSVTVVLLGLPTGGLADAIGRRPVLMASGLLHVGSCAAYATADGVPGFVLATFCSAPVRRWTRGRCRPGTSTPSTKPNC